MSNTLNLGNGNWATKEDSLLAYNSENGNFKPLPFDFTRASSATVVNKDGLIETVGSGEPRIDFKDNTKGALKLEPSRTNVVDNSSNFFVGSWSGTRVIEGSTINAPDGNNEAHKIIASSVSNTHYREYTVSSASGSYTGSCFFKKGEYNVGVIRMGVNNNVDRYSIYFNFEDGSFIQAVTVGSPTGTSYKIEDYGNGWYRLSVSIIHTSGAVRMSLSNASSDYSNSNGLPVFLGNSSDGGYSWGAQLEQGSYATSYIPTSGQANGVTRVADTCSNGANEQVINSTEGVLYLDFKKEHNALEIWSINDGSSSNRVYMGFNDTNFISQVRNGGGAASMQINTPINNNTRYKCALAYKENDFVLYINGIQIGTDNIGLTPINMSKLSANEGTSASAFFSPTNDVRVYNTRLSNAELQALTT